MKEATDAENPTVTRIFRHKKCTESSLKTKENLKDKSAMIKMINTMDDFEPWESRVSHRGVHQMSCAALSGLNFHHFAQRTTCPMNILTTAPVVCQLDL